MPWKKTRMQQVAFFSGPDIDGYEEAEDASEEAPEVKKGDADPEEVEVSYF